MAEIIKDLGIVTAYAYAVAKGYTGTEDEFAALMADYTVIGQEAADAVLEAQRQAGLAAGSAVNAETSKDAAVAAKEDAILAKGNAQAAAISAASSEATAIEKAAEAGRSVTDAANSATAAARSASNAHDSADTAHDSEVAAQSYASQAAASSVSASGFADNAEESAGDAADSASAAASSASAAASSVQTAAGHAASAAASAVSAENSASAAAESATSALESKNSASQSATAAASSESNAAQSESNASQSATNAASSATNAAGSATNAAQSAQAAQDVLDSIPDDYTELTEKVAELDETKANIDGYYEQMTVGDAEQLVATVGVEDQVPYNFRTSGGSIDIGDREVDSLVGGTIAWNQLAKIDMEKSGTSSGITYQANGDGYVTLNGTENSSIFSVQFGTTVNNIVEGHVYYPVVGNLWYGGATGTSAFMMMVNGWALTFNVGGMKKVSVNVASGVSIQLRISSGITVNGTYPVQLFDLTQMFGSAIADYIYSLETATAGAGVAWFRKLFPKSYYEYNAGELMSVKAASHDMVGFNQWDEQWEVGGLTSSGSKNNNLTNRIVSKNHIPVLPNTSYYFRRDDGAKFNRMMAFYDADKAFITVQYGNGLFVSPQNAHYALFSSTNDNYGNVYTNDICINISWDRERDGEYEPYVKRTYPLDDSLELRGIPKLDANNQLYYDGDTYESDGTVTRRYGVVDLGTFTYQRSSSGLFMSTGLQARGKYVANSNDIAKIVSPMYVTMDSLHITGPNGSNPSPDKVIALNTGGILYINNLSYTDTAAFKAAMSGVMLVYELATPTTEEAEPYTNPQIVDDFGTEEYVDAGVTADPPTREVSIPVGHVTIYRPNLRAKLEMAPNSPDENGDYILRHADGENTYVTYDGAGRLTALEAKVPAPPTTDGTYVLKCTVANGTPTYSWSTT